MSTSDTTTSTAPSVESASNNGPVHSLREQGVTLSLWRNESKNGDAYINTTISKSYKDHSGTWREGKSLSGKDLQTLHGLIPQALAYVQAHEQTFNAPKQEVNMQAERDAVMNAATKQQPQLKAESPQRTPDKNQHQRGM